jgi:nitrogen fixation protein NifU and related proteins
VTAADGQVLRNTDRARHGARNGEAIENPDFSGHAGAPSRGAFMIVYLNVQDRRIAAAKCHTISGGPTIASGSILTEFFAGKSIAECREVTVANPVEAPDGMPPDKLHCPAMATGVLKDASAKWASSGEETQGKAD